MDRRPHKRTDCRSLAALILVTVIAVWLVPPVAAQSHPDFEGTWNSATATPLERPAQLKDKAFFTPQEAVDWERRAASRREDPKPDPKREAAGSFASYNALFYETGTKVLKSMRTSIITDPPDGKIPALTPDAAVRKTRRTAALKHPQSSTDLGLQDQCIVFPTAAAPMIPYIYNSNYQFIQTEKEIMLNAEMIHDTRIIRMDGRPHLSPDVQLWLGDSIGHWEGSTLVVDTTNFNDGGGFFGDAGGMYGSDRNLHVVERFTLVDANTMQYRFEVDDPTAFSHPWKGELTWARSDERMFEYACHEGNYALVDLLNGERLASGQEKQ
jgi:hypothetical protein